MATIQVFCNQRFIQLKSLKTKKALEKYLDANFKGWKEYADGQDTIYSQGHKDVAKWDYDNEISLIRESLLTELY